MKTLVAAFLVLAALGRVQAADPAVGSEPSFAYEPVVVSVPETYLGLDYGLPLAPAAITNLDLFALDEDQQALLLEHGFVVVPADWREFYQLYERNAYPVAVPSGDDPGPYLGYAPMFITTDAVYHAYHLVFAKLLRDLERNELAPRLTALTDALVAAAAELAAEAAGESEAVELALAFLSVAQALSSESGSASPAAVHDAVAEELALIGAHQQFAVSPLLGATPGCADAYIEDYSQYTPRGHYAADPALARYFQAMMWYGRITLRLCSPLETQMALVLTDLMESVTVDGLPAERVWAAIYEPTAFLVGASDDPGFRDYAPLRDRAFGPAASWREYRDEEGLAAFVEAARELPPPRINSILALVLTEEEREADRAEEAQGFRFMGQRFVLDAFVLEELTFRQVGTLGAPRSLPRALDVLAAQGSEEALAILDEMGETDYARYLEQLDMVRRVLAELELAEWTGTLSAAWLHALQPLIEVKDQRFPSFMRTRAWTRKELQTALGSYTQLKHDTVLYAKQVMAELGGAPYAVPAGFVEPNPEAFARLLALVRLTRAGLETAGLLTRYDLDFGDPAEPPRLWRIPPEDVTAANLGDLESMLVFLLSAAERQLAGETLGASCYERILFFGGWLEGITLRSGDGDPVAQFGAHSAARDEDAAITVDIATSGTGHMLQQAIGRVHEIYVVVPEVVVELHDPWATDEVDGEARGTGGLQLAKGGVYSYYEFIVEPGARLTNEVWRRALDAGEAPPQPEWTRTFTAP